MKNYHSKIVSNVKQAVEVIKMFNISHSSTAIPETGIMLRYEYKPC